MNLRHRPDPDEAVAPFDHVLLEHCATFGGRQLMLCVKTADAASPDTVVVHVHYGGGQAEVTVRADEKEEESSGAHDPPSGFVASIAMDVSPVVIHQHATLCSSGKEQESEPMVAGATGPTTKCAAITSSRTSTEQDPASLAGVAIKQAVNSVTERDELTSSTSSEKQQDLAPVALVTISELISSVINKSSVSVEQQDLAPLAESTPDEPVKPVMEHPEMESCLPFQEQGPAAMAANTLGQDVSHAVECQSQRPKTFQTIKKQSQYPQKRTSFEKPPVQLRTSHSSVRTGKKHRNTRNPLHLSAKLGIKSVAFSGKVRIPNTIFQHILSILTWQELLRVRRVSKSWRIAADACLARYSELRIGRFDFPAVLEDSTLERLLQAMPAVRCLTVEWRLDGQKLDIDIVSQRCRNLVELDLTRFRLDTWSLEQLCIACPELQVVKLPRKCDDSCVEVLLRNLLQLRSLDLAYTKVTGRFLAQPNESMEKLSLAGCGSLEFEQLGVVHLLAEDVLQQMKCWKNLRELDMSYTTVTSTDVTYVLRYFPELERLSLSHCDKIGSDSLLLAALCHRLRDLDVSHVGSLQASHLLTVMTRCPQLERLALVGCTVLEPSCLHQIDQSAENLRLHELDVSAVRGLATADLTAILTRSPQLECLRASNFANMELTACLTQLRRCTELRELDVSCLGMWREPPPRKPAAQTNAFTLGGLPASRNNSQNSFGAAFSQSCTLKDEQQKSVETVDSKRRFIHPSALSSLLSGCQKLERLLLAGCHISESACLCQLVQCPKLRELDLSRVTSVDAADLAQGLRGCSRLERLSVAGLAAPLEQLVPPTGLPQLTYLDASGSGLTNNSLRRLRGMFPKLHTLSMRECRAVTQAGLITYLPRLQQLRSLDLRNVPGVTEALLNRLKGSHLSKLRLNEVRKELSAKCLLSAKGVAGLALHCQSLKFLGLESSDEALKEVEDIICQRLTPQWAFVMCVDKRPLLNLHRSNTQPGPLFIVDSDTVNWDGY